MENFEFKIGDFKTQTKEIGVYIMLLRELLESKIECLGDCHGKPFLLDQLILFFYFQILYDKERTIRVLAFFVMVRDQSP